MTTKNVETILLIFAHFHIFVKIFRERCALPPRRSLKGKRVRIPCSARCCEFPTLRFSMLSCHWRAVDSIKVDYINAGKEEDAKGTSQKTCLFSLALQEMCAVHVEFGCRGRC